ncbi:hypothetical protein [Roseibium algae]|uniref:SH3 domain-containing protein n=1 Tax=Roseibium algae TaxID=3123038 RepID=A0ABU8TFT9_9HYPH
MKLVLKGKTNSRTNRGLASAKVLAFGLALGAAAPNAHGHGFAGTDFLRKNETNYCVSKVAMYGKAPVLDHPDGHNVLYRLALGRCDLRITDTCQGLWCHVTFKGGKGWMFRTFLKESKT